MRRAMQFARRCRRAYSSTAGPGPTAPAAAADKTFFSPAVVGGSLNTEGRLSVASVAGAAILTALQFRHLLREQEAEAGERSLRPWQVALLETLPLRAASAGLGALAGIELPTLLARPLVAWWARSWSVDLTDAAVPESGFPSIRAAFGRALTPGARTFAPGPGALTAPCDGTVLFCGPLHATPDGAPPFIRQVKGVSYRLDALLGASPPPSLLAPPLPPEPPPPPPRLPGPPPVGARPPRRMAALMRRHAAENDTDSTEGGATAASDAPATSVPASTPPPSVDGRGPPPAWLNRRGTRPEGTTPPDRAAGMTSPPGVVSQPPAPGPAAPTAPPPPRVLPYWLWPFGPSPRPRPQLQCAVIYLAHRDYHRVHAPCAMTVAIRRHFPGGLMPVFERAVRARPGVYLDNERVVLQGKWAQGYLAVVAVGAFSAGSITVPFDPVMRGPRVAPPETYPDELCYLRQSLAAGGEMAAFGMGSTVILVFEATAVPAGIVGRGGGEFKVKRGDALRAGQPLWGPKG